MSEMQMILKSEAAVAFEGVLIVGREFSDQIERARDANDPVAEAMAKSFGMVALQQEIINHQAAWGVIERHMGNKWGFKTDRDFSKPYAKELVVACFCEAILDRLLPIGNEFNIIQSSTYVTKEGWRGKLERLPGVTKVDSRAGTITEHEVREFQTKAYDNKPSQTKYKMTATISATADCEVWGQFVQVTAWNNDGHDERLQLSASAEYADEVIDQLKGKVDARMLERLFWKCKGLSKVGPPDASQVRPKERIVLKQTPPPVEVIEHKAAEKPGTTTSEQEGTETPEYWKHQWNTAAKTVGHASGDPHVLITFATALRDATTVEQLDAVITDAKQNVGKERFQFSQKFMIQLEEYREFRKRQILGSSNK